MSLTNTAAAHLVALPTVVDPVEPADIFASFDPMVALPWVAAAIIAAVPLYFAVIGIRKGLAWFFSIVRKA